MRITYKFGLIAATIDVANIGGRDHIDAWIVIKTRTTLKRNTLSF